MPGLVWYRHSWQALPIPHSIVRGFDGSCCNLEQRCTMKAAGVIADGTEYHNTQWKQRKAASREQMW